MAIKPPSLDSRKKIGVIEDVIEAIINQFNPEDIYPSEYITKWIVKNVLSPTGGWYDLFEEFAVNLLSNSKPGDDIYEVMKMWADDNNYVQSKVPLDDRRFG